MTVNSEHPILSIDHGDARIGLAITDDFGILAYPLETIEVQKVNPIERILNRVQLHKVKKIVIGLPFRMDGSEGIAAKKIRFFASRLAESLPKELPLIFVDERLTTLSASEKLHQSGKNSKAQKSIIDQAAAVEILNSFLEENESLF